jgi:two-component system NtrC family sensor kinase
LALVSWLFNRQMEMALKRAKNSEKALKRQRDSLEIKVEQRTRQLQAAQLDQIQEFYRFAELGHLSTALFHDMANHLASVSIDIKGLSKDPHSDISNRIQNNISYIDEVVRRVRRQIQGQTEIERFNVAEEIEEIIKILAYQSSRQNVAIDLQGPPARQPIMYRGDLTRFRQIIINLLSNATEASSDTKRPADAQPVVTITAGKQVQDLIITVSDQGKGIKDTDQAKVFEPFYSTKDKGMGIGLFIVRQVTEKDFGGTINLTSSKAGTTFTVTLPLRRDGQQKRG